MTGQPGVREIEFGGLHEPFSETLEERRHEDDLGVRNIKHNFTFLNTYLRRRNLTASRSRAGGAVCRPPRVQGDPGLRSTAGPPTARGGAPDGRIPVRFST